MAHVPARRRNVEYTTLLEGQTRDVLLFVPLPIAQDVGRTRAGNTNQEGYFPFIPDAKETSLPLVLAFLCRAFETPTSDELVRTMMSSLGCLGSGPTTSRTNSISLAHETGCRRQELMLCFPTKRIVAKRGLVEEILPPMRSRRAPRTRSSWNRRDRCRLVSKRRNGGHGSRGATFGFKMRWNEMPILVLSYGNLSPSSRTSPRRIRARTPGFDAS